MIFIISEAVCLLVEREIEGFKDSSNTDEYINDDKKKDIVVKTNTNVYKENIDTVKDNANRFTTKQWKVNNELPCPICSVWINAKNFARHARQHELTTYDIFTSEKYKSQIDLMMAQKQVITTKD